MHMQHLLSASFALGLFISFDVRAAETTPSASTQDGQRGLRGLELTLRGSSGAASSDSPVQLQAGAPVSGDLGSLIRGASPYGAGFIGQTMIGYRLHPIVSFGLRGGLRTSSASSLDDGSTDL